MTTVTILQHFYGNVEADRSPTRTRGFQTLLRSTALSGMEVEEIESHVPYFPSDIKPEKRVFHLLSSGRLMLARILPSEAVDQFGRMIPCFAHTLIVSNEDFMRIGGDISYLWSSVKTYTSLADVEAQYSFNTMDIPDLELALPVESASSPTNEASDLPKDLLVKFALVALRAKELISAKTMIYLIGDPQYAYKAIMAALVVVPVAQRIHCTFDTYYYGCKPVQLRYWAVCLAEAPQILLNPLIFDLKQQRTDWDGMPETTYEKWVAWMINQGKITELHLHRDEVAVFCAMLDSGEQSTTVVSLPEEEMLLYFLHEEYDRCLGVAKRMLENISGGKALAKRIIGQVTESGVVSMLAGKLDRLQVLGWLSAEYHKSDYQRPTEQELRELAGMLTEIPDRKLDTLLAGWTGDKAKIRMLFGAMPEESYRQNLEFVFRYHIGKPSFWCIPAYAQLFAREYAGYYAENGQDFIDVVKELAGSNSPQAFAELHGLVTTLSPENLQVLQVLCQQHPMIPATFKEAVSQRLKDTSPEKGWGKLLADLKRLFLRS